ncbi:MAG: hypothetical protein JJU33_13380 [Phycisphaerales bacterium]|nr:hypothetical protein [Phycisphaerales bacterium]
MLMYLWIALSVAGSLLLVAGLLHALPKFGFKGVTEWLSRAPGLDVFIFYFTVLPLFVGPWMAVRSTLDAGFWVGLGGLVAAVAGQVLTVCVWTVLHEMAHREAVRGPRIVKQINRSVGPLRNHAAVWWTAWAVPLFAMIRIAQYLVYPPLTWLVRLPKYKHEEWVSVSRHKFEGLVGHDMVWCLYCDWMTGVWSLGSEMLRNVESFWCPIRFMPDKKCENCKTDFPDIDGGWAAFNSGMEQVEKTHAEHYPGPDGVNAWFGHPVRLTVKGKKK